MNTHISKRICALGGRHGGIFFAYEHQRCCLSISNTDIAEHPLIAGRARTETEQFFRHFNTSIFSRIQVLTLAFALGHFVAKHWRGYSGIGLIRAHTPNECPQRPKTPKKSDFSERLLPIILVLAAITLCCWFDPEPGAGGR